ncbi:MAG: ABC transporter permease [Phycisphaerae bacterium]
MGETQVRHWEIGHLKLRFEVVWSMAVSSLRVRLFRSFLTCLTITVATAFMMYLLTMPRQTETSEQQSWYLMLTLALIVAAAGVLNAMLMSVSQRYREIGTIKCLGALDSMVLYSVLLEAAMVGLIGAAAGAVVGGIISILLGLLQHGGAIWSELELGGLPWKVLFVFFVGMILTTLGASIPAWVAAKMPPVEAMRGEK